MQTYNPENLRRSRLLLPVLALLLSGLFLAGFIQIVSAKTVGIDPTDKTTGGQTPFGFNIPAIPGLYSPLPQTVAQLGIIKTKNPQIFSSVTTNTYIINITRLDQNPGEAGFSVEDTLPTGMTWVPVASIGNWNCSGSTPTKVSCLYTNNITTTQQIEPIIFQVSVPITMAGTVINTASLFYGNPVVQKNSSLSTVVANGADLALTKTQSPTIVPSEQTLITYTISLANNGPLPATNVKVIDTLSNNLIFFPAIPSIGTIVTSTSLLTWTIDSLPPNITAKLVLNAKPGAGSSGETITNTAKVLSDTPDWNTGNNSASTSFIVGGLEITKTVLDAVEPVQLGKEFTYRLSVVNQGGSASSVVVRDVLTKGLSYVSSTPSGSFNPSNNTFTFNKGSVSSGDAFFVDLKVKGNNQVTQTRIISNTASVNWYPDLKIDSNTIGVRVKPAGEFTIAKNNSYSTVTPNQLITYTVTVSNTGSLSTDSSKPITITETPGANLTFIKLIKNSINVSTPIQVGSSWIWMYSDKSITPGTGISFQVVARVDSAAQDGIIVNNQIKAESFDVEGNKVSATASKANEVDITPTTDFKVNKTVSPEQAQVGDTFTFKIDLHNAGSTTASNIRVNDYFPAVLELVSATTSRGTALLNTTTREVEVNIPTMLEDERTSIVITARVNDTVKAPKNYTNSAYIKWTGQPEYIGDSVSYRVLPSGTLPGTGGMGAAVAASGISGSMGITAALFLGGLLLLVIYLWMWRNRPLSARIYGRLAAAFLGMAVIVALTGLVLDSVDRQPEKLSLLTGEKPPVATSLPVLPASQVPPTEVVEPETSAPTDAVAPSLEAPDGEALLDLRPTPDPSLLEEQAQPTPTLTNGEIDISHLLPTATPSVLPDYPIPTPDALTTVGLEGVDPDASAISRLVIPAMGLDTVVKYVPYNGSTWLISGLKQEIAWMGDTSWPGLGSNTALAGHVDLVTGERGPFWNLRNLRAGDEVRVYTAKRIYIYRVSEQKVVDDTDMSVIAETSKPRLTMITCTGWDTNVRVYLKRLVVFADLVGTKTLTAYSN